MFQRTAPVYDPADALAFLRQYVKGDRGKAESYVGQRKVVVFATWEPEPGWRMKTQADDFWYEGFDVDELLESWPT